MFVSMTDNAAGLTRRNKVVENKRQKKWDKRHIRQDLEQE